MVKNLIESISALIPFLAPYPIWVKSLVSLWVLMTAVLAISLLFGKPKIPETVKIQQTSEEIVPKAQEPKQIDKPIHVPKITAQKSSQNVTITDSPSSTVYQAKGDIVINSQSQEKRMIQTIMIEGRLICDLKAGAELPPAEVSFMPVGDASVYFDGPAGKARLEFVSPVRFRRQDDNHIVVINRFTLQNGADLQGRPVESLKGFNNLQIPSITVVFGKSLQTMKVLEVTMTLNGQDIWYYRYNINHPFQEGPMFTIPLETLRARLEGK